MIGYETLYYLESVVIGYYKWNPYFKYYKYYSVKDLKKHYTRARFENMELHLVDVYYNRYKYE